MLFSTPTQDYYAWFSTAGSSNPGAGIPGRTGIQIAYNESDTATTLGGKAQAAIAAIVSSATVSIVGAILTITSNQNGAVTGPSSNSAGVNITRTTSRNYHGD